MCLSYSFIPSFYSIWIFNSIDAVKFWQRTHFDYQIFNSSPSPASTSTILVANTPFQRIMLWYARHYWNGVKITLEQLEKAPGVAAEKRHRLPLHLDQAQNLRTRTSEECCEEKADRSERRHQEIRSSSPFNNDNINKKKENVWWGWESRGEWGFNLNR